MSDVAAHPSVTINVNDDKTDLTFKVKASATVSKGGKDVDVSNKAVSITAERDDLKFVYNVTDKGLSGQMRTSINVNDTAVALTGRSDFGANKHSMRALFDISDDIGAKVTYDLSGYSGFNVDNARVGLRYKVNDDTTVQTEVALGGKTNQTTVIHQLDADNSLRATAHLNLGGGDVLDKAVLKLTNTGDVLGKGDLVAEATISAGGSVGVKVTKSFEIDL